jgi:hypothetical protein
MKMNARLNIQVLIRSYGLWVGLLAIPLIVNSAIWMSSVVPQQAKLQEWRDTQALTELMPKLNGLLRESYQLVMGRKHTNFTREDPSVVMQTVQRLAEAHRVQIKELQTKGQQAKGRQKKGPMIVKGETIAQAKGVLSGFSTMALNLEVTGHFNKLAHWISDIEAQSGLQVDSWTLTPGEAPNTPHQLTVTLTAFLRDA